MDLRGASGNRRAAAAFRGLSLALMLLSCGPIQAQPTPNPAAVNESTFELRVAGRRLEGGTRTLRVPQGERVTLRWTADEPMTIHVHGLDLEVALPSSVARELPIDAQLAGRFPVTAHLVAASAAGAAPARERALRYLEVHPR